MLWRWNKHILDRAKEKAFPAQRMKQGERRSGKEGGLSPPQKSGGNLLRLPLRLLIGQLFLVGEPGHVDVEYEWYRMKAKKKVPVRNKMVHEAYSSDLGELHDSEYESQIIAKIV